MVKTPGTSHLGLFAVVSEFDSLQRVKPDFRRFYSLMRFSRDRYSGNPLLAESKDTIHCDFQTIESVTDKSVVGSANLY